LNGIFVSGTDTGVGKTTVAAGLLRAASHLKPSLYWKAVQTGPDSDTAEVARLAGVPLSSLPQPRYEFPEPLSPHLAAARANSKISIDDLTLRAIEIAQAGFVVAEGAGGLLVPLCPGSLIIDLPLKWDLPVLLVAEDRLGAINHTLLAIEACRSRGVRLIGVIWNRATADFGNAESVTEVSGIQSLGRFFKSTSESAVAQIAANTALRQLF